MICSETKALLKAHRVDTEHLRKRAQSWRRDARGIGRDGTEVYLDLRRLPLEIQADFENCGAACPVDVIFKKRPYDYIAASEEAL